MKQSLPGRESDRAIEKESEMQKIALIGNRISQLLPSILADCCYAVQWGCHIVAAESNGAARGLLTEYAKQVVDKSGVPVTFSCVPDMKEALSDCDAVVFYDAVQPGSCFFNDREFLMGLEEENEEEEEQELKGLVNQARAFAGLEGLLHTMRTAEKAKELCSLMKTMRLHPHIVNLSEPLGQLTELFHLHGFDAVGMGVTALNGPDGAGALRRLLNRKDAVFTAAGIPYFTWLCSATDNDENLMGELLQTVQGGSMGVCASAWSNIYDAVPVGDYRFFGEFLPEQPDFIPMEEPPLSESIDERKKRILYMNTVREKSLASKEGQAAQLLLLTGASPMRPMQYLHALLTGATLELPALAIINGKTLPELPADATVEVPCRIENNRVYGLDASLPDGAIAITAAAADSSLLCAKAAMGDTWALRELIETDTALAGLDRLYCLDVVYALMAENKDFIPSLT